MSEAIYRKIAAEKIGRPLRSGEVVHHVNGDHSDNRPENLQVLPSHADHVRLHRQQDGYVKNQYGTFPVIADLEGRRERLKAINAAKREYRREWKRQRRQRTSEAT